MDLLRESASLMEQMSIDEAYLDVTDDIEAWEDAIEVAWGLQQRVLHEIGLSASLGVAANKLVAKIASDHEKPGGLTVVRPGDEESFLAPLPVRVLRGVGPVTAGRLEEIGVTTVGALAELSENVLSLHFGSHGPSMARQARGIDRRKVVTEHVRKSVSQERTFPQDIRDPKELRKRLWSLSQGVARYLRRSELTAGTVAVKLRYSDFTTLSRQMKLATPTDDEQVIYRAILVLFRRAWKRGRAVRLLGVAARNLCPPTGQLKLL
jgi:DNA polymerase-4